jgi:hypothetical protein
MGNFKRKVGLVPQANLKDVRHYHDYYVSPLQELGHTSTVR